MDLSQALRPRRKFSDLKGIKVGVLGGGVSNEREISLVSAQNVYDTLKRKSIDAVLIDIVISSEEKVKKILFSYNIDVAFIALHGEFGEDGGIQKILEELGIFYTGSERLASYRAMDKIISKRIFTKAGIPTAPFFVCKDSKLLKNIKYPIVVKPYFAGSSLGVSIVWQERDLSQAIEGALSLQDMVILEDYIEGRELTVGILEEKPLAVVEIIPKKGYFDFHAKYTEGEAEFVTSVNLEEGVYERVQEAALAAHCALGCRHFSRVDIRLDKNNIPFCLEVNSIPGLTPHSLLPLSAKACGIDFDELILRMMTFALDDKKDEKKKAQKI
ncbi:MAG: D-alanine--D-alanine ligase [Candidatus Omnitrophota bacterium]